MSATAQTRAPRFELPTGVFRYRELLGTLFRRELRSRYQGSVLGLLWSLVYPLAMMGVYTLVFSVLWRATSVHHYPLFVLSALAVWTFFQSSLQFAVASLVMNANLVKQVWFPRAIVPTATVLAQAVPSAIILIVVTAIDLVVIPGTRGTVALVIPMLIALFALTLGLSWIVATANVFFRDVDHLVTVLFLPWFFLTPVLYSLDQLPAAASHPAIVHILRYGNPITPFVEGIRAVIEQGVVPGASLLAYMFVVGPVFAVVGLWVSRRYDDRLAVEL